MFRVSVCLLTFAVVISLLFGNVYAASKYYFPEATEGQISNALGGIVPVRWLPGSPFYFLIVIKETTARMFQSSSAKRTQFDFVLSGKRLKEVYLLLDRGDVKQAGSSLSKYSSRLETLGSQLEKARSQNQDVTQLTAEMAEGFKNQEVLLYAISKKSISDPAFDRNLSGAQTGFVKVVYLINNVMPGVKDRFKTVTDPEKEATLSAKPSPSPEPAPSSATSSVKPRRIIY